MTTGMDRAVAHMGSDAKLGAALDPPVTRQAIAEWRQRGWAPPERVLEICRVTGYAVAPADLCSPVVQDIIAEAVNDAHS